MLKHFSNARGWRYDDKGDAIRVLVSTNIDLSPLRRSVSIARFETKLLASGTPPYEMNPMTQSPPSFLVGLIGTGIRASRSPALHEHEASAHGVRYWYRLIDLDAHPSGSETLSQLITAAERMGFAGLNITHPVKQAVIPLLTDLSDDAHALGAVNTVVFRNGRRIGHNTDWWGFAQSFRRGLADARIEHIVQLGAGGAGAAVAHAALTLGATRLDVFDLDAKRAERLAEDLCNRFGADRATAGADLGAAMAQADGLIQATPVGMADHPGLPLPAGLLRAAHWVAEIVYFPLETELLRTAHELGCRTLDGGGIAVFQAAEAFRLFTGIAPDEQRMLDDFAAMSAG